MKRNQETEEILYDFDLYFDSLFSNTLNLEGKVILIWNKGTMKRIVSEENWSPRSRTTIIAKSIKIELPLYYNKNTKAYHDGCKIQLSCYIQDPDYSQPVLIGTITINLSEIINEQRDRKGKIKNLEIGLGLQRCDYPNTSLKIIISGRKNYKFSKNEKMKEINERNQPESKDGTFQILDNEMLENIPEKYVDDEDDEFFRGYSYAKEYDHERGTFKSDTNTQDIRNKILLEDFTPGRKERKETNEVYRHKDNVNDEVHTPLKGDQDTIHFTQTREEQKEFGYGSGRNQKFDHIKMINFDQIEEEQPEERYNKNSKERESALRNMLQMYEQNLSSFIEKKDVNNSREIVKEKSLQQSDK